MVLSSPDFVNILICDMGEGGLMKHGVRASILTKDNIAIEETTCSSVHQKLLILLNGEMS